VSDRSLAICCRTQSSTLIPASLRCARARMRLMVRLRRSTCSSRCRIAVPEFRPTSRASSATSLPRLADGKHAGGVGLAISKHAADALGCRLEVTSAVGNGATFALCIPVHVEVPGSAREPGKPDAERTAESWGILANCERMSDNLPHARNAIARLDPTAVHKHRSRKRLAGTIIRICDNRTVTRTPDVASTARCGLAVDESRIRGAQLTAP